MTYNIRLRKHLLSHDCNWKQKYQCVTQKNQTNWKIPILDKMLLLKKEKNDGMGRVFLGPTGLLLRLLLRIHSDLQFSWNSSLQPCPTSENPVHPSSFLKNISVYSQLPFPIRSLLRSHSWHSRLDHKVWPLLDQPAATALAQGLQRAVIEP